MKTFFKNPENPASRNKELHFYGLTGPSMQPTLTGADLLEVTSYGDQHPSAGDVILFKAPDGCLTVHRIVRIETSGLVTQGDNCSGPDPWRIRFPDIIGRVIAAHRRNKRSTVRGGALGKLDGSFCYAKNKIKNFARVFFRPLYRILSCGNILHWFMPFQLHPQVVTYRTGNSKTIKLLHGKRVIGSFDDVQMQWQIRQPYRLFVDKTSLPGPR